MPTLTEVLLLDRDAAASAPPQPSELTAAVLAELAPRIELLLEARLREAMAPALARVADGLIRDAREQLAAALQALVEDSVARALQQRPSRQTL